MTRVGITPDDMEALKGVIHDTIATEIPGAVTKLMEAVLGPVLRRIESLEAKADRTKSDDWDGEQV